MNRTSITDAFAAMQYKTRVFKDCHFSSPISMLNIPYLECVYFILGLEVVASHN